MDVFHVSPIQMSERGRYGWGEPAVVSELEQQIQYATQWNANQ